MEGTYLTIESEIDFPPPYETALRASPVPVSYLDRSPSYRSVQPPRSPPPAFDNAWDDYADQIHGLENTTTMDLRGDGNHTVRYARPVVPALSDVPQSPNPSSTPRSPTASQPSLGPPGSALVSAAAAAAPAAPPTNSAKVAPKPSRHAKSAAPNRIANRPTKPKKTPTGSGPSPSQTQAAAGPAVSCAASPAASATSPSAAPIPRSSLSPCPPTSHCNNLLPPPTPYKYPPENTSLPRPPSAVPTAPPPALPQSSASFLAHRDPRPEFTAGSFSSSRSASPSARSLSSSSLSSPSSSILDLHSEISSLNIDPEEPPAQAVHAPIPQRIIAASTVHELATSPHGSHALVPSDLPRDQSVGVSVEERSGSISSFNAPSIASSTRDYYFNHNDNIYAQPQRFAQRNDSFASSITSSIALSTAPTRSNQTISHPADHPPPQQPTYSNSDAYLQNPYNHYYATPSLDQADSTSTSTHTFHQPPFPAAQPSPNTPSVSFASAANSTAHNNNQPPGTYYYSESTDNLGGVTPTVSHYNSTANDDDEVSELGSRSTNSTPEPPQTTALGADQYPHGTPVATASIISSSAPQVVPQTAPPQPAIQQPMYAPQQPMALPEHSVIPPQQSTQAHHQPVAAQLNASAMPTYPTYSTNNDDEDEFMVRPIAEQSVSFNSLAYSCPESVHLPIPFDSSYSSWPVSSTPIQSDVPVIPRVSMEDEDDFANAAAQTFPAIPIQQAIPQQQIYQPASQNFQHSHRHSPLVSEPITASSFPPAVSPSSSSTPSISVSDHSPRTPQVQVIPPQPNEPPAFQLPAVPADPNSLPTAESHSSHILAAHFPQPQFPIPSPVNSRELVVLPQNSDMPSASETSLALTVVRQPGSLTPQIGSQTLGPSPQPSPQLLPNSQENSLLSSGASSSSSSTSPNPHGRSSVSSANSDISVSILVTPSTDSTGALRRLSNISSRSSRRSSTNSSTTATSDVVPEVPSSLNSPTLAPKDLNFEITEPSKSYDIGDKIFGAVHYTPTQDRPIKSIAVALVLNELLLGKRLCSRTVMLAACYIDPQLPGSPVITFANRGDKLSFPFELTVPELLPHTPSELPNPLPLQQRLPPSFTFVSETRSFPFVQIAYSLRVIVEEKNQLTPEINVAKYTSPTMIDNSHTITVLPSYAPADFRSSNDAPGGKIHRVCKGSGTVVNRGFLRTSITLGIQELHVLGLQTFALKRTDPPVIVSTPGVLDPQPTNVQPNRRQSMTSITSQSSSSSENNLVTMPTNSSSSSLSTFRGLKDSERCSTNDGRALRLYLIFFPNPAERHVTLPLITGISVILKFRLRVSTQSPFTQYPAATPTPGSASSGSSRRGSSSSSSSSSSSASSKSSQTLPGVLEYTQNVITLENVKASRWAKLRPPPNLNPKTIMYGCTAIIPLTHLRELYTSPQYRASNHKLQVVPTFVSAYIAREYEAEITVNCDPPKAVKVVVPIIVTADSLARSHAPFAENVV